MTKVIIILIAILILTAVGILIADSNRFVVKEYTVFSDKINKPHDFLFISDLHCKEYGKNNEKLFKAIDSLNAEAALLPGDMMIAIPNEDTKKASYFVSELKKRLPIYYSMGNHEYRAKIYKKTYGDMYDTYISALKENDVKILDNEVVDLGDINIYALTIDKRFYKRFKVQHMEKEDIVKEIGPIKNDKAFNILLAHNPDYFDVYAEYGADLTLSGHVHGGLYRIFGKGLFSPRISFFPKYDGGEFTKDNKKMIVSRGLGNHSFPHRFLNPGELILIHLKEVEKK
ncbi:MAG: metallophosphoesterase [Lachnospiraceae bacterium]|nr:metallophosphoesterase [Lachnospiraceae bacterium]